METASLQSVETVACYDSARSRSSYEPPALRRRFSWRVDRRSQTAGIKPAARRSLCPSTSDARHETERCRPSSYRPGVRIGSFRHDPSSGEKPRSTPKSQQNRSFRRDGDTRITRCARHAACIRHLFRPLENPSHPQERQQTQSLPQAEEEGRRFRRRRDESDAEPVRRGGPLFILHRLHPSFSRR